MMRPGPHLKNLTRKIFPLLLTGLFMGACGEKLSPEEERLRRIFASKDLGEMHEAQSLVKDNKKRYLPYARRAFLDHYIYYESDAGKNPRQWILNAYGAELWRGAHVAEDALARNNGAAFYIVDDPRFSGDDATQFLSACFKAVQSGRSYYRPCSNSYFIEDLLKKGADPTTFATREELSRSYGYMLGYTGRRDILEAYDRKTADLINHQLSPEMAPAP